ncbi:hypothetical protein DFJ63DRAFT_319979 [Scheffersomyces coipomensis]|uniref:uncharacterized protein n=1 Tax=Scheffersomyces coipomensis TaxID=1788519 RepID=UPI00315CF7C2
MLARQGLGLLRQPITSSLLSHSIKLSSTRLVLNRSISTIKASHEKEQELLIAQRKNRPESPHLTIYQPQLTWILSSFHRITGVALAGMFYALTCTYAATSILGISFDSASIVGAFATLPFIIKLGAKAAGAYPFAFHIFNGVRHLVWDFGSQLTIPGVYTTGYIVLAATGLLGTYLAFF